MHGARGVAAQLAVVAADRGELGAVLEETIALEPVTSSETATHRAALYVRNLHSDNPWQLVV